MEKIEALEKRLWEAADQLRANSGLGSNEYFMPILGILFLRQAFNRFSQIAKRVEESLPTRGGVKRQARKEDFTKRRSIFLREESQYEYLAGLSKDKNIGAALNRAMELIEQDYESLKGELPKDYGSFSNDLLKDMLRIFNDDVLKQASGDVFGRIYEYFLMKFSMQGAHDNGEFFTPPSIVQTIVNTIEPNHGIVFDPACGSGGMFVQTSHFLEMHEKDVEKVVTFYGQEKNDTTIRIAKMNLAVHALEGNIQNGNTFYEDKHEMLKKSDFVMANPPFNVNNVDAEKIKNDPRLPFGLPGVNKKKKVVSNGNYLWISYFYSYLNPKGRAGFVMSSQASSAGHTEELVRQKIVQSGHVDVMIAIRSNFFYTRTVPCELWFFDKGKPKEKLNKILMIDARNVYRKVTRKINDFSPEQLKNVSAIVWLYRGETENYLSLIREYFGSIVEECSQIPEKLHQFEEGLQKVMRLLSQYSELMRTNTDVPVEAKKDYETQLAELVKGADAFKGDKEELLRDMKSFTSAFNKDATSTNAKQIKANELFEPVSESVKSLKKQIDALAKLVKRLADYIRTQAAAKNGEFDRKEVIRLSKEFTKPEPTSEEQTIHSGAMGVLERAVYFHRQVHWLQAKFPDAELRNVEGLVKLVDRKEIEKNDWSLTPGRYVGVAPAEVDDDFDFEEVLRGINTELVDLNSEAQQLAKTIHKNFEELWI